MANNIVESGIEEKALCSKHILNISTGEGSNSFQKKGKDRKDRS